MGEDKPACKLCGWKMQCMPQCKYWYCVNVECKEYGRVILNI